MPYAPDPAIDARFMRRAVELAMRGRGTAEPNPLVGCVIVQDGREIGAGWHQKFGEPHAEPNALAACEGSPRGATVYVTLEPCCHLDKQTPPCVPRLIEAGLARVVIGCVDPNPEVAGRGVAQLRSAGVDVDVGVLDGECRQLIAPFYARLILRRTYVTLKWAQTSDGKIAGAGGARLQISNAASQRAVHGLRSRCDAILVGVNTVLADDPLLTARDVSQERPLRRIVLDSRLRTPLECQLVRTARNVPVEIHCATSWVNSDKAETLRTHGLHVSGLPSDASGLSLNDLLQVLGQHGKLTHLLVEPGPALAQSFFAAGLVDRVWIFESGKRLDEVSAPAAAARPAQFDPVGVADLGGDRLTEYLNPASGAYFFSTRSADFALAAKGR